METTVIDVLRELFVQKGATLPAMTAETVFDGSFGLDSLDFAEMVIRLELLTGKDPFGSGAITRVRTIGDLVALYTN